MLPKFKKKKIYGERRHKLPVSYWVLWLHSWFVRSTIYPWPKSQLKIILLRWCSVGTTYDECGIQKFPDAWRSWRIFQMNERKLHKVEDCGDGDGTCWTSIKKFKFNRFRSVVNFSFVLFHSQCRRLNHRRQWIENVTRRCISHRSARADFHLINFYRKQVITINADALLQRYR